MRRTDRSALPGRLVPQRTFPTLGVACVLATLTGLSALPLFPCGTPVPLAAQEEPVRVVTTLPIYASIAREVGRDDVDVTSIAEPVQDAHFVRPKPSFALSVRNADLFVTTGLDLELWVPALLDRAGNSDVAEGGIGYVTAHTGIALLDVPSSVTRSEGDVHIYGNPHLHTDPLRVVQIARNITTGLTRVDPGRRSRWEDGLSGFTDRIHRALFGDELVEILGGEVLEQLASSSGLYAFLEENTLEGAPLTGRLGGWLGLARGLRGRSMVCYHRNWAYLEDRFGFDCAEYVERRPGIPPTPRHLADLVESMRTRGLRVVWAANYFDDGNVRMVAERGQGTPLVVPLYPGGAPGVISYFDLVDAWVEALVGVFGVDTSGDASP